MSKEVWKLGERLEKLLKERNMTQERFAELLGVNPAMISYYKTGKRKPSVEMLVKMAQILGVTISYLIGETNDPSPPKLKNEAIPVQPKPPVKLVPVFSTTVSAGNGIFPDSFHPEAYMPVERYDVDYVFVVRGKSMEPYILDGSKILIKATSHPRDGEMILCIYDGMFYVKYFHQENDQIYLVSEDSTYPPIPVEPDKQFEIIGVVVEIHNPPVRKRFRKHP